MSIDILQNRIVLVNLDFRIWSGYRRTTESDLKKVGAALPSSGVLTKGGKKIFPSEFLSPFGAKKKEISRKLASVGVAALGGSARAIPAEKLQDIEAELKDAQSEVTQMIQDFEANYDRRLDTYIKGISEQEVSDIIRLAALEKSEAVARFGIGWQVFKIIPAAEDEETCKSLISDMTDKLYQEIAQGAKEAYERSFFGKPRVGQKALHQIVALRNKLAGLEFMDGDNISLIVNDIDDTLDKLPKNGWIEDADLSALVGVVLRLQDPETMLQHAAKINAGIAVAESVQPEVQITEEAEEPAVEVVAETPSVEAEPVEVQAPEPETVQVLPAIEVATGSFDFEREDDGLPQIPMSVVQVPPAPQPARQAAFF